ncbi:MAG: hypothetical protein EBT86_10800 [Actinobacteria bacterium]|nr:hypothetical protein [Actinomycetota bacterium]NBU71108.1 hypothetical protein [Bacteroidota bacterium]
MKTNDLTMTLETANLIWNACYGSPFASDTAEGWATFTSAERQEAIEVRDAHANGGQWGIWNISDRD